MGNHKPPLWRLRKERARKRASEGSMAGTGAPVSFSTGICDCCTDCESCRIGYFVPSILYGQNKEKIEGVGQFMPDCCAFFWIRLICGCFASCLSYQSRENIRNAYNLKPEPCGDCCTHLFCLRCALCQEARELKFRGATQTNPALVPVQTVAPPVQTMPTQGMPVQGVPVEPQSSTAKPPNPYK